MPKQQITIEFSADAVDVTSASSLPSIGCGAESIFIGRTRPEHHDIFGDLTALEYDCYQEMAKNEIERIAEEALKRYGVWQISVVHSIGIVAINEASVVISIGSDHRDNAQAACKFMIDALKQHAPIWKQELWEDGTTWANGEVLTKA